MKTLFLSCTFIVACLPFSVTASEEIAAREMADAANNFLAALTPEQKAKTVFELKDDERLNWHFIPRDRKGLPLKEMTVAQRHLATALLASAMSQEGLIKSVTIMSLEDILRDIEQGKGPVRDPERYFISVFGKPAPQGTWGWRVEGHHLALNFTVVNGKAVSTTPSFFGSNPGQVREGPRQGLRVLGAEEDLGRQLLKSLDDSQRKAAVFSEAAPKEIITEAVRKASALTPGGLSAGKMTPAQVDALRKLINAYVRRYRAELADEDLRKIEKAGIANVPFAWAGGLESGTGHYYRVQGPTFLLEYDNTQNNANHVHAVWREFDGDFGEDLLKAHYRQTPHSN
jgi:hypothetical protein